MNFRAFPGLRPPAQLRLRLQTPPHVLRSKLSRHIALSVWISVMAINAVLSLPALHHQESVLLRQRSAQSEASVIRHDTTAVDPALLTFGGQLFMALLLRSLVMTLAIMIVLQSILITPILALQEDLQRATSTALHERAVPVSFASELYHQNNELGAVILAFKEMVEHCSLRNISDREQAQTSQARLAEVGELAAMIVHEVRNPLATIYMVLDGFYRLALPPSGKLRLELAMEEAERLKRLLNEILTYSREQKLQGEAIELNALCKALWSSLQAMPAAQNRSIYLKPSSQRIWINGDRDKLKQVFINLITNACEAIPSGEAVVWTLEVTSPSRSKITIHNGGEPIPPDILPKLTRPFVSTKANGNGLGLALTRRIVEAHGGGFAISSNADAGTTVTVELPHAISPSVTKRLPPQTISTALVRVS